MFKKIFIFLLVFTVWIPQFSYATTFRAEEHVHKDEIINDNLYIFGSSPLINGTVEGDVAAFGGTVTITGNILDDAMVSGGNINITGTIGEDLRMFGGNIFLDGTVNGEVTVVGGQIKLGPNALITGDLIATGGSIVISPDAEIQGKQTILQNEEEVKDAGYHPEFVWQQYTSPEFYIANIWGLATILVVAVVLFATLRKTMPIFLEKAVNGGNFWKSLGLGLLLLLLTPLVAFLFMLTGVGFLLGLILLIGYVLYLLLGAVFAGILFGGVLFKLFKWKSKSYDIGWGWMIAGIFLLFLINFIPVAGWILPFVFFILALGTMPRAKLEILKRL